MTISGVSAVVLSAPRRLLRAATPSTPLGTCVLAKSTSPPAPSTSAQLTTNLSETESSMGWRRPCAEGEALVHPP